MNAKGVMKMNQGIFSKPHCGVTLGFYAKNGYFSSAKAKEEVDEIAKTGVDWIVLVVTVMQEGYSSTRQFRDFEQTPNDIEIKEIIDYIHGKGLHVQLRPMLECYDGLGRLGVQFTSDRERMPGKPCTYASRWFESMKQRSVYYARIAALTGCELFCLDSELDRIIMFHKEWKAVIRAVREVYHGPVTSCHTVHTGVIDFEKELQKPDHWFYDLDALSLSDYIRCADRGGLSAEEMAENMIPERDRLRRIAALYKKPVFLTDYPKEIKAFYMKQNADGKTVAAADLLVPGIGELCGGSQREEDYDKLYNRIKELGMNPEDYSWYLDLRKYGGTTHSGFGMGFERMIMYLTGISNIRDVLPYPRTFGDLKY